MNHDELIRQYCKTLRLGKHIYESYAHITANDFGDFLAQLLKSEVDHREVARKNRNLVSASFDVIKAMATTGNPNSVTDAGVGALCARSAVMGAFLNVKINAAGLKDRAVADALTAEAEALAAEAVRLEAEVLQIVESKIG